MSPFGWRHGIVVDSVEHLIGAFVRRHNLGRGFGAETGFLLKRDPDTVRAPNYAFVANQNLPAKEPVEAFWPGAPDLVVEVLSPDNRMGEVNEKIAEWLEAGCAAVWIVDPKTQAVTIYRSLADVEVLTAGEVLSGSPVLPGFFCAVDEFFR